MPDSQFATITCEVEYEPTDDEPLPEDERTLKNVIAARVEDALDGHKDLMVYGRVKVELS